MPSFPLELPHWPPEWPEIQASVESCMRTGAWGKYHGEFTDELRRKLSEYFGLSQTYLCSSGTIGVELALRGVGVQAADEVILAAYDFPGNFRAVEAIQAFPVLVDLSQESWKLDVTQLEQAITPKTKAILVSYLHGSVPEIEAICEIASRAGVAVVEDLCQSPGAEVNSRKAGTFGTAMVLSFGGSKLLTAGRGGAVLSARPEVNQRIKIFSERGNDSFPLSELQASVLIPQLNRLDEFNRIRAANVGRLMSGLSGVANILLDTSSPRQGRAFYKLGLALHSAESNSQEAQADRRALFLAKAQSFGLPIDVGFRGFASRTSKRCRVIGELPNTKEIVSNTMVLHHTALAADSATTDLIVQAIRESAATLRS